MYASYCYNWCVSQSVPKPKRAERRQRNNSDSTDDESIVDSEEEEIADEITPEQGSKIDEPEEEEDDWEKFQEESKKDNALETKSKESHLVHCPYFPLVRTTASPLSLTYNS